MKIVDVEKLKEKYKIEGLKALKEKRDIIFRNMEKCGNEFFFVLKQIIEKNSFFLNIKQEVVKFEKIPRLIFIYNSL